MLNENRFLATFRGHNTRTTSESLNTVESTMRPNMRGTKSCVIKNHET